MMKFSFIAFMFFVMRLQSPLYAQQTQEAADKSYGDFRKDLLVVHG